MPKKKEVLDPSDEWTPAQVRELKKIMRRKSHPTYAEIGASMGKTGVAVRSKWYRIRLS